MKGAISRSSASAAATGAHDASPAPSGSHSSPTRRSSRPDNPARSAFAPATAAEEHAAELAQGPEAAGLVDPLAPMEGETHGLDADAGEYLNKGEE